MDPEYDIPTNVEAVIEEEGSVQEVDALISQQGKSGSQHHLFGNYLRILIHLRLKNYLTQSQKISWSCILDEPELDRKNELDVLEYWKRNKFRYPELALMARDVLALPVSTVASGSALGVGGRVVDKFGSAIKPANVETLVATKDLIFEKKDGRVV